MKAWKGLVGGRKEDNLFGLHEIVEVVSLIDGERGLGWVLEICFGREVPARYRQRQLGRSRDFVCR